MNAIVATRADGTNAAVIRTTVLYGDHFDYSWLLLASLALVYCNMLHFVY
jgi:hypothetical protein